MPRLTRKHKHGGARGETMRFIYTTNPLRRGWTETMYPLAQFFLRIPSQIPWNEYEYIGPTTVDLTNIDIHSKANRQNFLSNQQSLERIVNAALEFPQPVSGNGPSLQNQYAAMFNYKELSVRARCHRIPYELFGGAVCELYDRFIQGNRLGIKLHETTDPTGDMDILMKSLDIELTHPEEIEPAERASLKSVVLENKLTNTLSPVYDHYTRWILNHVLRLLEPIVQHTNGPHFFRKGQAGNAELFDADILEYVGNFLVSRAITRGMIKIQCGIGVNTPEGPIADHIFEFVFPIQDIAVNDATYRTSPPEMAATYSLPVVFGPTRFSLFVQDPVTLLNGQAKGFIDRIELRTNPQFIHKLHNHYGRILFCLQLLLEAHLRGIRPTIYKRNYFPYLNEILYDNLLDRVPSPCYEPCKKKMIEDLYQLVLDL
jgi:hypothetical protein